MQDFWDLQFQFSRLIPNFAHLVEQMGEDSLAFAKDRDFERIAYGPHDRQWVEWTPGQGSENLLPIILHGGYWRALTAETHRYMMAPWLDVAKHVGNIEYRLIPEVRLGDIVDDARQALLVIAERFPDCRIILIGHSAGAHLAISALNDTTLASQVAGVIALSGVYDLAPVAQSFLQAELTLTRDDVARHSLKPRSDHPPVLYVNGDAETYEFLRGGALMASQGPADWHVLKGANHMSLTWAASAAAPELLKKLMNLEARE